MNVSITPELERFVAGKVESGRYTSASEVVREALRLLEEQDQMRSAQIVEFNRILEARLAACDRGELVDPQARESACGASRKRGGGVAPEAAYPENSFDRLGVSRKGHLEVIAVITVTFAEAQGRLVELLEGVDESPVTITREGRPDAFLVSAAEIEDLVDARRRSEAAAEFEAWKRDAEKELAPAAAELTDEEINRLVHELR